jgi:hypothetical protein
LCRIGVEANVAKGATFVHMPAPTTRFPLLHPEPIHRTTY